jgi:hypothetical protein
MPSRVYRPKKSASAFDKVVGALAATLDEAACEVERERQEEVRKELADAESSRRQLRARGIISEGPDWRDGMSANGRFSLLPERHPEAEHAAMRYGRGIQLLAAALRATGVRALQRTPHLEFSGRLRKKKKRRGERMRMEPSAQRLIQWLAEAGVTSGMTDEVIAEAHLHPVMANIIASMHRNCAAARTNDVRSCSGKDSCPVMAVCRALSVVVEGLDTPLKAAERRLANVAFDAAGHLSAIARDAERQNHGLRDVIDDLAKLANLLLGVEGEIRQQCLTSYYDQAPRGARPRQAILIDATRWLAAGGFSDEQIAAFLDDGSKNPARRARRVADLLNLKPGPNTWIGYARAATPEQIARADREPDLVWLEGRPYRRTGPNSFEHA